MVHQLNSEIEQMEAGMAHKENFHADCLNLAIRENSGQQSLFAALRKAQEFYGLVEF
jgi:hypothetical protein